MPEILTSLDHDEVRDWENIKLTPKQDQFIFSEAPISAYGGGVGNGKSFAGCIKIYNHCQDYPGAFVLVGRRHATDLRDSTQKDFLSLFGDFGVWKEATKTFIFENGSEVIFRHLDDLRSLTNMNLSYFWIDQAEEVPEDAFTFLMGRIRRQKGLKGQNINWSPGKGPARGGALTFNMDGHNWIWRMLLKKVDKNGEPLQKPENYHMVVATSLDNPNTPDDYKERILSMPKEWVDRFVYGNWDDFAGQIFSEWQPVHHLIDPFPIPSHWERFRAIDHGQNNPTACLWFAVDPDANIYLYQEYYQPDAPVSEHVKNIISMSYIPTTGGGKVLDEYAYTVIDPSTKARNRERDGVVFSVWDEYMDAGIHTIPAQNDVLAGINRVKEHLLIDERRFHPTKTLTDGTPIKGSPRFFVFKGRAPHLEEEILGYKWKPQKYGVEANNNNAPVKKDDHAVDALRYGIMSRPISPEYTKRLDPRILNSPMQLAKLAMKEGMTVNDYLVARMTANQGDRITHSGAIEHEDSGFGHSYSDDTEY